MTAERLWKHRGDGHQSLYDPNPSALVGCKLYLYHPRHNGDQGIASRQCKRHALSLLSTVSVLKFCLRICLFTVFIFGHSTEDVPYILSVRDKNIVFLFFIFMSQMTCPDEPLTPNIDKVVPVEFVEGGLKTQKSQFGF